MQTFPKMLPGLGMEDRLGSSLGIAGFWSLGMEDRLEGPLGIAGFLASFFFP